MNRPQTHMWSNNIQCTYCHRIGHLEINCRKKQNTCFLCGSRDHLFRQCHRNRDRQDSFRNNINQGNYINRSRFDNCTEDYTTTRERSNRAFSQPPNTNNAISETQQYRKNYLN